MSAIQGSNGRLEQAGRCVVVFGIGVTLLGSGLAYWTPWSLSIAQQVGAHALIIIGPAFLKLGYIAMLSARRPQGRP